MRYYLQASRVFLIMNYWMETRASLLRLVKVKRLEQCWTSLKTYQTTNAWNLTFLPSQNKAKAVCLSRVMNIPRRKLSILGKQFTGTACLLSDEQCCLWKPHLKHSSCWLQWESAMSQKWRLSSAPWRSIIIIIAWIVIGDLQSQSACYINSSLVAKLPRLILF